MQMTNPFRAVARFARRIAANRRGNVLMLMGFSVIPLTLAGGIAVDYARAARLQTKLNAAADAAALATVSQQAMTKTVDAAKTAGINMFKSQIGNQPGLIWNDADLQVVINGDDPKPSSTRTTVVTYTAKSINAFSGIIGMATVTIGGSSTATATAAPNIDFYLALDTSPSMALPTTTAGFTTMDTTFKCAFACHSNKIEAYATGQSMPNGMILDNSSYNIVKGNNGTGKVNGYDIQKIDANNTYVYVNATVDTTIPLTAKAANNNLLQTLCSVSLVNRKNICVYNADGSYVDSYWYAQNKGLHLRITDERTGAVDLMALAQSYAQQNNRTYRAALYTFDHSTDLKKVASLSSDLAGVGTAASNIDLVTVNDKAGNGRPPNGTSGTEYLFTSFNSIMTKMLSEMPLQSGNGSDNPGDTPQAFLFMVTDGMSDENIGSGRTRAAMQDAQIQQCTQIKNRGIQIAILYTEYTVASIQDDEPNQRAIATASIPNIAPQLIKCASPGLMYTVKTDQSITDALQALFTKAVASARILQ